MQVCATTPWLVPVLQTGEIRLGRPERDLPWAELGRAGTQISLCSPLAHPSAFGGSSQVSHFSWTVDRKRPKRGVFSSFFSIAGCRFEDGWGWGVDGWWAEEPILVCKRSFLPAPPIPLLASQRAPLINQQTLAAPAGTKWGRLISTE